MKRLILDGQKLHFHRERVAAWLNGERIAPVTVDCALTRRCTYRCVYCYGQLQANDEKKMTGEVISRFLDDAAEIGVKAVSFVSDGESTCSPHLNQAILTGKANGLDMALATNGYLLDDERLHEILPALTYLRFNMSAADPGRYSEIMGCAPKCMEKVVETIKGCVSIKNRENLPVTIGLQMVLLPEFSDQIIPLAELGRDLGVDYFVIKHCSDDEKGSLGVNYEKYFELADVLKEAEGYSGGNYLVKAKWSKIMSSGKRLYSRCLGPPFIIQFSGSGLVAPCGMFFNSRYKKFHIGNIVDKSFREIWKSERYWDVMRFLASDEFDARTMCGSLCLQHKVNEFLWGIVNGKASPEDGAGTPVPEHVNFI